MGGRDFREGTVLAAAKPLKSADSAIQLNQKAPRLVEKSVVHSSILETLFQRHHDRVFRTAYRMTGAAADAEDVLQTVFLRVARDSQAAAAAENSEAYFARAAINASLDLLRSRQRSKTMAFDDVENAAQLSSANLSHSPERDQEDRELRDLIREAVSKLGSTAAQMFALRYFEGLSNAEIATAMNTSPLVVGVTLHRARARLRREIGRYLIGRA